MTTDQIETVETAVSAAFREAFEARADRYTDPGEALAAAREEAATRIPVGVHGSFDDVSLSFSVEVAS
jgi:hypothetical protein